jgi:hypothetical protein
MRSINGSLGVQFALPTSKVERSEVNRISVAYSKGNRRSRDTRVYDCRPDDPDKNLSGTVPERTSIRPG